MIHRHLEVAAGTPVGHLPSAALVDILDRGDLDDWRELAADVARAPHGPLARRVDHLVDAFPMYGTSSLWRAFIDRSRARAEGAPSARLATLPQLRRRQELTQVELATRMGISQSDLSKLERRADVKVSTLRAYLHAAGAELRLLADAEDGVTELCLEPCRDQASTGGHRPVVRPR